ncbi:uncharacterized protein MELLADRAFT_124531 [Melampsora larici-populina 98AG31]|uniref:Secreted protein n=1 Tax=Melampsora larici-populina (strain 98AG31 / pathotype 3-4-7) TaxID=747676 RepID=F4R7R9_MELLP|nr:uncharacterized protein MELLADRAFT_124532 [Melampsora larici-populina 98AG31]XP_007419099.1 uncharacterized protein MELLADRAFT_124531 [Melampsora larici-populina 98AG31]EGF97637.1 secreted protein [Melampsora larici-populina 98AG31]EGG11361.1 secreted protein [Melampsora larici-populina 98AG31]
MLFFKIIIAAVLAATISASPVQVDQTVTGEVLQRRSVEDEVTPIIKKRSSSLEIRFRKGNGILCPICRCC